MSITSTDIHEQAFGTSRNGYDMQEVDDFLELVANSIDQLHEDYQERIEELQNARVEPSPSPEQAAEIESLRGQVASLRSKLQEQQAEESVISEAFISAQRSANRIKEEADETAAKIRRDAENRARAMIGEAQAERQLILDEIDRLEKSRQAFANDFIALIKHFEDDAKLTFENGGISVSKGGESHVIGFKDISTERSYGTAPSASDDSIRRDEPIPASSYKPGSVPNPKVSPVNTGTFNYGETGGIDVNELD